MSRFVDDARERACRAAFVRGLRGRPRFKTTKCPCAAMRFVILSSNPCRQDDKARATARKKTIRQDARLNRDGAMSELWRGAVVSPHLFTVV